eukprot:4114369-Pyramimonas_sp.AAC.1
MGTATRGAWIIRSIRASGRLAAACGNTISLCTAQPISSHQVASAAQPASWRRTSQPSTAQDRACCPFGSSTAPHTLPSGCLCWHTPVQQGRSSPRRTPSAMPNCASERRCSGREGGPSQALAPGPPALCRAAAASGSWLASLATMRAAAARGAEARVRCGAASPSSPTWAVSSARAAWRTRVASGRHLRAHGLTLASAPAPSSP